MGDMTRAAAQTLHAGKIAAADRLDGAADTLRERADRVSDIGNDVADRLGAAAKYVRKHKAKDYLADVSEMVQEHPGKSLTAALMIGLLLGRMFARSPKQ
jgi:ElaB/YqjD/DUF883 family membrane-anchored ribosome-binding protein